MTKNLKRRTGAKTSPNLDYHGCDRWFTTARVLLTIAPLISLGYLNFAAGGADSSMQSILADNPEFTVSFLASMSGPFIAYLMKFVVQHVHGSDADYAIVNLTLMMIGEAMLSNLLYFIMMIVLLYFVMNMTGVNPVTAFRRKWTQPHFWGDLSGSLTVLAFCALCMFFSYRLGML